MSRKEAKRIDKFIANRRIKPRRKLDKEFRSLYKAAIKTIRRIKAPKETKEHFLKDLLYCNNIEIMHYLGNIKPETIVEYVDSINSLLEYESAAHDYHAKMVYHVGAKREKKLIEGLICYSGGFAVITEHIRKHHKFLDLKSRIIKPE